MKKKVFYFGIVLFLLTIILIGCGKDEDVTPVTPPTPVVKSTLTTNLTPVAVNNQVEIPWKGKVVTTWLASGLTSLEINGRTMTSSVVYINGVKQPNLDEGSIDFNDVTQDMEIKIRGLGKDGVPYNLVYDVKVGQKPAPTAADTLKSNYWMYSTDSRHFSEGKWSPTGFTDDQLKYKFYYQENNQSKVINSKTGNQVGSGIWTIVGKTLTDNGYGREFLITNNPLKLTLSEREGTILTVYNGYPL